MQARKAKSCVVVGYLRGQNLLWLPTVSNQKIEGFVPGNAM